MARTLRTLVAAALSAVAVLCAPSQAQEPADATHTLNFRNADIVAFIEDIGVLTGYTLIVHPEVRGTVTVTSTAELTRDQVFEVFLSTLRTYGYTAIPTTPGTYRIVPETAAAQNSGAVGSTDTNLLSDEFVTEVFQLEHVSANEAARVVTPLVNHRGQVAALPENNMLTVVDYVGNIDRIREILADLDQDRTVVQTVTLVNASAYEVAQLVNAIEGESVAGEPPRAVAVALEASNSLVLRGEPESVARMRGLVSDLDVASMPTENLRVIALKNAQASEVVPILEAVARTMRPPSDPNTFSIPYDEATNSVILTADPQTLQALVRVVEQLDIRRPQVAIEAIIVEISDGLARDLGVQYLIAGDDDSSIPFSATNFSRSAPNLLAITGALTIDEEDGKELSEDVRKAALASILGLQGGAFGVGGQNDDGLFGVILNAVEDDDESNVLSTPHITTLDNELASILVGQNIPITTGEALGSDNVNPFRTIERQDIGVKLFVTPQINEGDTIKLNIRQEVSSIFDAVAGEFITNKREIETTVLADDGEIIVLGGLIENTESQIDSKVPLLGDVPLVGRAFSSTSRERSRTNLVVFIRARILRDAESSRAEARRSMDQIVGAQSDRGGAAAERFDGLLRGALGQSYGGSQ
jgi:general secretion pathway protein D